MDERVVPPQYKCPVCGKWGRSHHSERNIPYGYLYCNPKSRTGGKGCGEIFKHLRSNGCEKISFVKEYSEKTIADRTIELGFRMVQSMKNANVHDPFRRKCEWKDVYNYHREFGGMCYCGCGQTTTGNRNFATSKCTSLFYDVAEMIASQGKTLQKFLIKLRGKKCEKCSKETSFLEIDHIVEVNEGGGLCWIDNYQLLCSDCHKEKTKAYAGIRAERARALKELGKPQETQLSLF
jgi:5-methylcytosine-specific restriction endonuclease McrA